MKHFAHFANIYETGLKNLISNNTEPAVKKYIRKKKEQANATSSDEKEG